MNRALARGRSRAWPDAVHRAQARGPRRRAPFRLYLSLAALGALAGGCGLSQEGVMPHGDTLSYPASAVTDPTGQWLFVANANADLRYNDGTLVTLDVAATRADRFDHAMDWAPCPEVDYVLPYEQPVDPSRHFCCWDRLDPAILDCDERSYITAANTRRIGTFSAGMVWIDPRCPVSPACGNCQDGDPSFIPRIALAVRGDASLTYFDVPDPTNPVLDCGGSAPFAACDDAHRLTETYTAAAVQEGDTSQPPGLRLPDEPYALALDPSSALLYLGHLTGTTGPGFGGGISVFDVAPVSKPSYLGSFQSPFPANGGGLLGITSLTAVQRANSPALIYATSRYLPNVTTVSSIVVSPQGVPPTCGDPGRQVLVLGSGGDLHTSLGGSETRGVQVVAPPDATGPDFCTQHPDQCRSFVLQRSPPALVAFEGGNTNTPTAVLETCDSPTELYQHNAAGTGVRLFVTCFGSNEIYVFDPTLPELTNIFRVGRGPAGIVFPGRTNPNDIQAADSADRSVYAYVLDFNDNNLSVVDLRPGSETEYHVIQRLGFPSTSPR